MKVLKMDEIIKLTPNCRPELTRIMNCIKTLNESDLSYEILSALENKWIQGYVQAHKPEDL